MDISQLYWVKPGQDHGPDHYVNEIFLQTNTIPTQCYFVNDNSALFIRFPQGTNLDKWHSTKNLKVLADLGLTLKTSSTQLDKNSVFINSAPETIFNLNQEALLAHINEANTNIQATGAFVPPKRNHHQKLGSVKLTVATRNMVNSILSYGIRIGGCHIEPGSIRQAHYLKEPQCTYCYRFHPGKCQADGPNCPICAQQHSRHQCKEKDRPKCINCRLPHKATSNHCRVRGGMLTNELINDVNLSTIKCPFGKVLKEAPNLAPKNSNNSEWPPINTNSPSNPMPSTSAWSTPAVNPTLTNNYTNPLTPLAPKTSYYDVLRMSLMFNEWYPAFISLMGLFGLPVVEFPLPLRDQFRGREVCGVPTSLENTFPSSMINPNPLFSDITSRAPLPNSTNHTPNLYKDAQDKAQDAPFPLITQDPTPFPLTGANTVPLPIRPKKDEKGKNKSSKGKGLLPTPPEPILPSSISLGPIPNTLANSQIQDNRKNIHTATKELQWGDDPNDNAKAWATAEDTPEPESPAPDMPVIDDGTQIYYPSQNKNTNSNRLSMDKEQFQSTIKNFENLSGAKPKGTKKSPQTTQISSTHITPAQNTLADSKKTKFNVGSNRTIYPKPKAISKPHYKHSTPSPQKEGMSTSSESETDSEEEVNIDDVDPVEEKGDEQEDTLEDLTKSTSETTTTSRRQLRSKSKSSTN